MNCCLCKQTIDRKKSRFSGRGRWKNGRPRKLVWCADCDVSRADDVERMLADPEIQSGSPKNKVKN